MAPPPDDWEKQFADMKRTVDQLSQAMASRNDEVERLGKMMRRQTGTVGKLQRENRKLRSLLGWDDSEDDDPDPDSPGGLPLPDVDSVDDELAADESTASEDASDRPRNGGKGGGRNLPPEHLDTTEERHRVNACSSGGGDTVQRDVLTTPIYTVVPMYVRRRVIHRERCLCKACGSPTTAAMPPMPCARALYDCRFLAWIVVMKFVLLVPLDRIRLLLESQGVHLAMGTLVKLVERASRLLDSIDGEHLKQLKAGPWMSFDGTGLKALVLGYPTAWDGYFEVYTRDEITVFQFDLTKHANELRKRLGDYAGMLVCDAESRNKAGAPNATLAFCNAHPIRAFREMQRIQPVLAVEGEAFLSALFAVDRRAAKAGLDGIARSAYRKRHTKPILKRFRKWLRGVQTSGLPPSDPLRKLANYYIKHFANLTRFLAHGDIPLDNNGAEREFQRHAKLRFASLFAGSEEGAHRWATILGVVRTAQKCDLDVQAYLTWVFERRGTHKKAFGMTAAELTPMAYRDQAVGSLAEVA
jgi:transposase